MSALGAILLGIIIWFAYNFIVKFVLPVYRTTKKIKKQFSDMAEQRKGYTAGQAPTVPETPKEKAGEYIEFEEVKEGM